nr:sulfurtransferase [Bacillus thuringiensis]
MQDWQGPIDFTIGQFFQKKLGNNVAHILTRYDNPKFIETTAVASSSPKITDLKEVYVGRSILRNNTDIDQTLYTDSYSETITESTTSAVTHGFNIGESTTASLSLPIVGAGFEQEVHMEYNISTENSTTKEKSRTYTAPSQAIVVPAHSSVEVIVKLDRIKADGKVDLFSKMKDTQYTSLVWFKDRPDQMFVGSVYDAVRDVTSDQTFPDIKANKKDKTISLIGKGNYKAVLGTTFSVNVKPVNKEGRAINDGYTYKVNPQITDVKIK